MAGCVVLTTHMSLLMTKQDEFNNNFFEVCDEKKKLLEYLLVSFRTEFSYEKKNT